MAHDLFCPIAIALLDRLHKIQVLLDGAGQKTKLGQGQIPQPLRQAEQPLQPLRQVLVVGCLGDCLMKLVVHLEQPAAILGRRRRLLLAQSFQDDQVIARGPLCCQPGAQPLQSQSHLAELFQVGHIDIGYVQAVARSDHHQAVVGQQL